MLCTFSLANMKPGEGKKIATTTQQKIWDDLDQYMVEQGMKNEEKTQVPEKDNFDAEEICNSI